MRNTLLALLFGVLAAIAGCTSGQSDDNREMNGDMEGMNHDMSGGGSGETGGGAQR